MIDNIVMSEEFLNEVRIRNEERLKEAKERLGNRYLLHPSNMVKKVKVKRKYAKRKITA